MQLVKPNRNGLIELYRFIFAVVIVFHHARYLGGGAPYALFGNAGYIGVEFFFLVSGFLLAKTALKPRSELSLGYETGCFMLKKIKALLPFYSLAVLASLISEFLVEERGLVSRASGIFDILFLGMSGIKTYPVVNASWYLSAMLICMIVIYPLTRKYRDKFIYIIAPIISILLLGYLSRNFGNLNQYNNNFTLVYTGLIRAFAEISLGVIIYAIVEKLQQIKFTKFSQLLISALNLCLLVFILFGSTVIESSNFDYVLLLAIALLVSLTFAKVGLIANLKIFNAKLFTFLGKLSLVIYLNHMWVKSLVVKYAPQTLGYNKLLVIFLVLTFVVSFVMMLINLIIGKISTKCGCKVKKLFVKE